MFSPLNFPPVKLRLRKTNLQQEVFDPVRKKFIVLTPEEWVRQHFIHFLIDVKGFPSGLMEIEKQIHLFQTKKRVDILIRDKDLKPLVLIECKASEVTLSQKDINQLLRYQISLGAPYCILSNGLHHLVMKLENGKTIFLDEIPEYAIFL